MPEPAPVTMATEAEGDVLIGVAADKPALRGSRRGANIATLDRWMRVDFLRDDL